MKTPKNMKRLVISSNSERVHENVRVDLSVSFLAKLATDLWHLKLQTTKLLGDMGREDPALAFTFDKLFADLKGIGWEIKDPSGEIYREGLSLDVRAFDYDPDNPPKSRVVQETLRPAIYFKGRLVRMAQVIVGTGREDSANG